MLFECLLLFSIIVGIAITFFLPLYQRRAWRNTADEISKNHAKDTVILHCYPKINLPSNIPTPQPFVLKLKLFMKLAKINYVVDTTLPNYENGKSPWISLNGVHSWDSQRIIEILSRKFDVNLNAGHSLEQIAVARAVRVMLEERFVYALMLWRLVWPEGEANYYSRWSKTKLPFYIPVSLLRIQLRRFYKYKVRCAGIGLHDKVYQWETLREDLRCVSAILGGKKYILGDQITEEDCGIFGMLGQALYGIPDSPFERLMNDELHNLQRYCERIRQDHFGNWDK